MQGKIVKTPSSIGIEIIGIQESVIEELEYSKLYESENKINSGIL